MTYKKCIYFSFSVYKLNFIWNTAMFLCLCITDAFILQVENLLMACKTYSIYYLVMNSSCPPLV